jgi:hypothetical protein
VGTEPWVRKAKPITVVTITALIKEEKKLVKFGMKIHNIYVNITEENSLVVISYKFGSGVNL